MKDIAVIFDLNGTIADTERAYFLAYQQVLAHYNIDFQIEHFTENWSVKGKKLDDFLVTIGREELLSKASEILSEKDAIFQNTIEDRISVIEGAPNVVALLHEAKLPLGLDSSTTLENIRKILAVVNLEPFFPIISSGDGKIDPKYGDIKKKATRLKYLADTMGFAYAKCIVIGDAEKDVEGVKQAGMLTIAVPNMYTRLNDFSNADAICETMDEITVEHLEDLVKRSAIRI